MFVFIALSFSGVAGRFKTNIKMKSQILREKAMPVAACHKLPAVEQLKKRELMSTIEDLKGQRYRVTLFAGIRIKPAFKL